ncbi:hypothetical protein ANCCAN_18806, partial [Ancylostoma caninum]
MRGRVFIISFFLGFCSYQTSPGSPWPPWPIKWNLDRNEYEDAVDIQRMVYIHFNCTCDYLTRCGKPPLVRYGYVDILHTEAKYQVNSTFCGYCDNCSDATLHISLLGVF